MNAAKFRAKKGVASVVWLRVHQVAVKYPVKPTNNKCLYYLLETVGGTN